MFQRLLSDQKHSKNVGIKHSVKLFLGDFFEGHEFVNPGVINQDVDLAEGFLRFSEEPLDFCFLRNVGLDRDCFSAALTNFVHHAIRVLLCGSVVNDDGCPLSRKLLCDAGADSLRRACNHRNFSI